MFNKKIVRAQWLILGVITCVLLNSNVQATESHDHHQHHDPHAKHKQMGTAGMEEQSQGGAELDIPEPALLNQYGQSVNFRQDVVADNIVVMDFIYTSCTTVCPVLSAVMAQVWVEPAPIDRAKLPLLRRPAIQSQSDCCLLYLLG